MATKKFRLVWGRATQEVCMPLGEASMSILSRDPNLLKDIENGETAMSL